VAEPVARVVGLWRYPVKSMAGEPLTAVEVGETGLPGDRGLAVRDPADGRILSAKREPRLLSASARVDGDAVVIGLPDGRDLVAGEARTDAALSAWLGRRVELVAPEPGVVSTFTMDLDPEDPTRVSDLTTPPGSFSDSRSGLHLLTTASLAAAARLDPGATWDVRRFRPNVVLESAATGFAEDQVGADPSVLGEATVWIRKATERCVLATRQQPGLPRDSAVLRALHRGHEGALGVYANPVRSGRVAVGDRLQPATGDRPAAPELVELGRQA
jgi:uncharacterized protein YcbX